jgi:hypothetical protein
MPQIPDKTLNFFSARADASSIELMNPKDQILAEGILLPNYR